MKFSTPMAIVVLGIAGAAVAQAVNSQAPWSNNQAQAPANAVRPSDPLNNANAVPTEDRLDNRSDNGVMRNEADPPLDARSPQAERLSRGGTRDSEATGRTGAWSGTGAASSASGSGSASGTSSPR